MSPTNALSIRLTPQTGSWILLVGPRDINSLMHTAITRLGQAGPLRILDGGNRFRGYEVARALRSQPEALERITISRAFTCYQMFSLLESTAAIEAPFILLDLLNTFYDESVRLGDRKRLLRACIYQLERLQRKAGGVVSVHPPAMPSPQALELLQILQTAAKVSYFVHPPPPPPEPLRLFH